MRLLSLLLLLAAIPVVGLAQTAPARTAARLVEARLEPQVPTFAEPFELHLTLRVRPGVVAFLPVTLTPAGGLEGVGAASWSEMPAPADSVDVRVVYPMIAFEAGRLEFPEFELWVHDIIANDAGRTGIARSAAELDTTVGEGAERRVIELGSGEVALYPFFAEAGAEVEPRPPADVLGGEWSFWLVLAIGVATLAGLGGAGLIGPYWWAVRGSAVLAQLRGRSPRQQALRELDRIRSLGWHRNGHMDDFYALSTGTLRRFAGEIEPAWDASLTSSELLKKVEERWGTANVCRLTSAIEVAEKVKFGLLRPNPDDAEGDWMAIREWIRRAPAG